jgi:hypothetical protein
VGTNSLGQRLFLAITKGYIEKIAEIMQDPNLDINYKGLERRTFPMIAIMTGNLEIA